LTGDISVSDIDLAQASEAVVLGFNVQVPPAADAHAKECGIEVKQYNVIYDLVDDIRKAMEGMMEPEEVGILCVCIIILGYRCQALENWIVEELLDLLIL
jgi:translation initiation factor IF-2